MIIDKHKLNIHGDNVNFFICNNDGPDIVSQLIIDNIKYQNNHFGIIMNGNINDPLFDKINVPLYAISSNDYYLLDIIHDSSFNYLTSTNILRFIFINIEKLANGLFVNTGFQKWLTNIVMDSINYKHMFFVSNKTPYHYLSNDNNNQFINDFVSSLMFVVSENCYYIATDNDWFQVIDVDMYPFCHGMIKHILIGKMSTIIKPPQIFDTEYKMNFLEKINYIREKLDDKSGFVEIVISKNSTFIHNNSIYDSYLMKNSLKLMIDKYDDFDTNDKIDRINYLKKYCKYISEKDYARKFFGIIKNKEKLLNKTLRKNFILNLDFKIKKWTCI